MPRYKTYDYDQLLMVPVSLDQQLMPGTLEYAIHTLIEERIDTSVFDQKYRNDETGRTAYDPKVLLKIVLFAYSRGMLHSRPIERACKENITFMALACGQQPDHSTIAAFVSSMGESRVVDLFTQVLLVCQEDGLLGGTHFSLDGLKLSSNASKEWSGKHADLKKKQAKLQEKVKEAVREHREADRRGGDPDGQRREQRIKRLKQKADRIEKFLSENEPKQGKRGKEIQGNVTDNESAKMVTSHGIVQGYNANAVVDEKTQVVVHPQVFGDGEDGDHVAPMLEGAKSRLEAVGHEEPLKDATFTADTSYYSIENLQACKDEHVDAYIPDRDFRKRDPRFMDAQRHRRSVDKRKQRYKSKKRWFTPEDFTWDDRTKKLICPAGHALYKNGTQFETKDGYLATSYRAAKRACTGCALRAKCMRNPEGRSRQVRLFHGRRPGSITDAMKAKIDTPEGRKTYGKRLGIVEPVFGNIRACKGMDRFTLRGRLKVNIQWTLYCMVHNIGKLAAFGTTCAAAA
jgi:transposase